ncbi:hypothetical protein FSP39_000369 [Pinctada imbricata]|uniref:Ectonucleotide pyrophosphatase/phosphodiesterase family member 5 n=1 Tax=Pinctada imbricata TaxID=66713 RepID=A0AA88XP02_PINIB|nr:hypothetical protein FSP39_000369 [Pinctada imbricata]
MGSTFARDLYENSTTLGDTLRFVHDIFPTNEDFGLNEESHGIIGNHMYDPVFNATFGMGTKETRWWDGGEPIWVTARKHNLTSATYFWPGSETEIRGYRPNIWLPYNESHPFRTRIDRVIDWFVNENIDIATLYFHEPDHTGHVFGPDSQEILAKVREMDGILGYLMKKFEDHNLWDTVNMIVTSDHGMTSVDFQNKAIVISELVSMDTIKFTVDSGPIMQIFPVGRASDLVHELNSRNQPMTVYLKEDIPDFWHYKNNRRVMPVFAVADEGWSIVTQNSSDPEKGNHGYDNRLMSMKPIFYAAGPNFKKNFKSDTFRNVDIYPLICELLGISPSPNNGSLARVEDMLEQCETNMTNPAGSNVTKKNNVSDGADYVTWDRFLMLMIILISAMVV